MNAEATNDKCDGVPSIIVSASALRSGHVKTTKKLTRFICRLMRNPLALKRNSNRTAIFVIR